ncbi:MAG: phosphotransferase [Anaerolineaceae bacterium]|nr:phosphotransferase [Anaerolineaceae bacterium]
MKKSIKKEAAKLFGTDTTSLSPLDGGHVSHIYQYPVGQETYVLRITPPGEDIDAKSLRATLEWMHFLAENGAAVARPLLSLNGNLIETILSDGQLYLAAAVVKADGILGEELEFNKWNEGLVEKLGATLGQVHHLSKTYRPPVEFKKPLWDQVTSNFKPIPMDDTHTFARLKSEKYTQIVKQLPHDNNNFGLIHMDLHGGNFFVDPDTRKFTLFDFDDCAYGWFSMDIAMNLFDMLILYPGDDRKAFADWYLTHFLKGYYDENKLDSFWIEQIPVFQKLLETGIYSQVIEYFSPETTHSWSLNFMKNRRESIKEDIPFIELDFKKYKQD